MVLTSGRFFALWSQHFFAISQTAVVIPGLQSDEALAVPYPSRPKVDFGDRKLVGGHRSSHELEAKTIRTWMCHVFGENAHLHNGH